MKTQHSIERVLVLALLLIQFRVLAQAQNTINSEHWVAAWAASPQQPPAAVGERGPATAIVAPVSVTPAAVADAAPTFCVSSHDSLKEMNPCA